VNTIDANKVDGIMLEPVVGFPKLLLRGTSNQPAERCGFAGFLMVLGFYKLLTFKIRD
jgi:hypothetical protein